MTRILQPSAAPGLVQSAFGRLKQWRASRSQLVVAGEVFFVAGWSLMWATSLGIVPHVPPAVWLAMMISGLLLGMNERMPRGHSQLAGTFPTKQEVLQAALAEGLVQSEVLPASYSIERVEQCYDPQPGR